MIPPSDALRRLKESGRKLILVSGRQLPELQQVFPAHEIFDVIVAENGALMWVSQTKAETLLAGAAAAPASGRTPTSGSHSPCGRSCHFGDLAAAGNKSF